MNKDNIKFIKVGFGKIISLDEVVAVVSPASAPIKRIIQKAKEEKGHKDELGREKGLVDYTEGRKTRSAVITNYGKVYLSALHPETILAKTKTNPFDFEEPEE